MATSSESMTGLDVLQLYSHGGRYLDASRMYLSEDGKEMFFLGGGENEGQQQLLPVSTRDATEEVFDSYTLASVYLLCIHPNDFLKYRKACERSNCVPVKATDKQKLLTMLLGEDYYTDQHHEMEKIGAAEDTTTAKVKELRQQKDHHKKKHRDHKIKEHAGSSSKHHQKHKGIANNESSTNKRSKTSTLLSKDQVLENLTLVADKRSDKRQQEAPTIEDKEVASEELTDTNREQDVYTALGKKDTSSVVSDEENVQIQKQKLRKMLSDKTFIVTDDGLLGNDLQKTAKIVSMEIPVGDSFSILRAPGRDLSGVLEMFTKSSRETAKLQQQQRSSGKNNADNIKNSSATAPQKPIIVVPNAMTSPITIINAIEFLSHAKYVPREVMLKQRSATSSSEKQQPLSFTRKISSKYSSSGANINTHNSSNSNLLEYEVIDNPSKFLKSRQDWERIVAVITLGASWQFKGYPGKLQQPVELFNKAQGFFFGIQENTVIPKECQGWNIKTILLARDNRGLDGVAHAKFWNSLDEWMSIHKPALLPSSSTSIMKS